MKKLLIVSVCFWVCLFFMILSQGHEVNSSWLTEIDNIFPYNSKSFYSHTDIFDCLSDLYTTKTTNSFFTWCCDFINYVGRGLGYNYQEINVIIFVIIQPLIILNLLVLLVSKISVGRTYAKSN
jgi:hypothetical protein